MSEQVNRFLSLISTIAGSSGGCYRRVKNNMGELLDMIGFLCPAQSLVSKLADSEHTTDCDLDFESVSHLDISILEWPCADSPMASRNRAVARYAGLGHWLASLNELGESSSGSRPELIEP
ncbi:hypothetical protein H4S03_006283 [Coemansia sp. S3946]|nr:hypothetical protein H4S03_006283 [Coemansia sp. S3946]KAJ2418709.1 hypothetical protein GGF41_004934 [Coemansia sp. RSA 2531]